MGNPEIAFIVALILAIIEEFRAQGRSLISWAVILVCIGLLYPSFVK